MKPCKSLVTANKVLEGLINSEELKECWYHSFYSGGINPDGFCGYMIYGERAQSTIRITFYGTNKDVDTPISIFIAVDGKSKVRNLQFSIEDAITFIITKINKFMIKVKGA